MDLPENTSTLKSETLTNPAILGKNSLKKVKTTLS
jgi:hypothetical protein